MFHHWKSRVLSAITAWMAGCGLVMADAPERPLVFIPGIIGSVLSEEGGDVVWGDLGSLRGSNFHKLNLLPTDGAPVEIVPTDALRDVPLLFGTMEVGLYSGLIDFLLGKMSLADRVAGNTLKGEYVEGETLFVFPYDWRRSNFANALKLDSFIAENIPTGEYDLIAHSMGGLVTRIMLSQRGPNDLCTTGSAASAELSDADYQDLCNAIYGPAPGGSYPSEHLNARRNSADRMHTFVEMAVPHYGSVNLAATLLEGWGRASEVLLGGKLPIQNTVLSMAAPVELLPTYKNCCARGRVNASGNRAVQPHDEEFWLNLLLAFGQPTCPYDRCDVRRALFRNGIANRKIIDDIMNAGLPSTVAANHGVTGRKVKNTRQTVYVAKNARGNGDGVTYKVVSDGDGTVHEVSAALPQNKQFDTIPNRFEVSHSSHPFIIGDDSVTRYVFDKLIDPVTVEIEGVSGDALEFAGGKVAEIGLDVGSQVIFTDEATSLKLSFNDQRDAGPFDPEAVLAEEIAIEIAPADGSADAVRQGALSLDEARSLVSTGRLTYVAEGVGMDQPGIYTLSLVSREGVSLAKSNLYVLEK